MSQQEVIIATFIDRWERSAQIFYPNPTATAETLSQHFGRKNQKRTDQISSIIDMLKGLGLV